MTHEFSPTTQISVAAFNAPPKVAHIWRHGTVQSQSKHTQNPFSSKVCPLLTTHSGLERSLVKWWKIVCGGGQGISCYLGPQSRRPTFDGVMHN